MTFTKRLSQSDLVLNIINDKKEIILICPGGGYTLLSNRESGPISVKFNVLGYNTAILYYSLFPMKACAPYNDGIEALDYLSKSFDEIIVMGFSAGGHLAGLLGAKSHHKNLKGMVLAYPVISLKDYTHDETASNFMGGGFDEKLAEEYSVHKCVDDKCVPTFIWATRNDELVPIENTLLMEEALNAHHIPNQIMIYPDGPHGMALADETAVVLNGPKYNDKEIAKWPILVDQFIKKISK